MAFRSVNNRETEAEGQLYKWTQVGQCVEGTYRGVRAGKYGPDSLLDFDHQGRTVTMSNNTVLRSALKRVPVGSLVQITYRGKRRGPSGSEYRDFDVAVDDGGVATPGVALPTTPYGSLLAQIKTQRGETTAKALDNLAQATDDPLATLRDAAGQLGIQEAVPF